MQWANFVRLLSLLTARGARLDTYLRNRVKALPRSPTSPALPLAPTRSRSPTCRPPSATTSTSTRRRRASKSCATRSPPTTTTRTAPRRRASTPTRTCASSLAVEPALLESQVLSATSLSRTRASRPLSVSLRLLSEPNRRLTPSFSSPQDPGVHQVRLPLLTSIRHPAS